MQSTAKAWPSAAMPWPRSVSLRLSCPLSCHALLCLCCAALLNALPLPSAAHHGRRRAVQSLPCSAVTLRVFPSLCLCQDVLCLSMPLLFLAPRSIALPLPRAAKHCRSHAYPCLSKATPGQALPMLTFFDIWAIPRLALPMLCDAGLSFASAVSRLALLSLSSAPPRVALPLLSLAPPNPRTALRRTAMRCLCSAWICNA